MTKKINERAQRAALELSPYELKFADLYLSRTDTGYSNARCVLEAYPGHQDEKAAATTAWRLLHTDRVLNYLGAMGANAMESVGESFDSSVEYWRTRSLPAKELLQPYCELIEYVNDDNRKASGVRLWVKSMRDIPDRYQSYVEGYLPWEGGWLVIEQDLYDAKARNTARQQLDKLVGNAIERIELSGVLGQVAAQLPESATAEDVAVLYTKMLTGQKK